jgi:hypothetical protein
MSGELLEFDVLAPYVRWRRVCSDEAAAALDPRARSICQECERAFAWRGYEPLCGWCYEDADET